MITDLNWQILLSHFFMVYMHIPPEYEDGYMGDSM